MSAPRARRRAATGFGTALIAAAVALIGVTIPLPAAAEVQEGPITMTPGAFNPGDPGGDTLGAFLGGFNPIAPPVMNARLVCPDGFGPATFLSEPGAEQPTVDPASNSMENFFSAIYGSVLDTEDGAIFPSGGGQSAVNALRGTAYFTPGFAQAPLFDLIQTEHTYSLGLVCSNPSAWTLAIGSDGTPIVVYGTFTVGAPSTPGQKATAPWTFSTPKRDSSVTLAATKSSAYGATLTATVPPDATGEVEFFEGDTQVGTAPVSAGKASVTLTDLEVGTHTYEAAYLGDDVYNPSVRSAPAEVTIEFVKLDTTVALQAELVGETGATVTATVAAEGQTATGATGEVEFYLGGESVGTEALEAGLATLAVSDLEPGTTYSFTASYVGDPTYNASPRSAGASITTPAAPVELKDGDKATPGVRYYVDAPVATFEDGDTIAGVVNSDPISLPDTATADADGSARYVFTLPTALADSTEAEHTLVLTGDPSGATFTLAFTIDPAQPAGNGGGSSAGVRGDLASTGGDSAALALVLGVGAGALALGGGTLGATRLLKRRKRAA